MEKNAPILTIRPLFDQGLVTVQAVLFAVVAVLPVTVIVGTVLFMLFGLLGLGRFIDAGYLYGLILVIGIVGLPPLFFEMKKKAYGRTVFHFFEDHADYQHMPFFMGLRRSRLRYRDIADVRMEGQMLQEQRRLTNIVIYVPSMAPNPRAFGGVKIPDVPISQDYMIRIMDLIEKSEMRDMARAAGMMQQQAAAATAAPAAPASAPAAPPVVTPPAGE